MDAKVEELLMKERKRQRNLLELYKARERLQQVKSPDQKLISLVEKDIAELEKQA